jgi:hypothetical protein
MGVSVRDLVDAKMHEALVKDAIDAAGFERKRGRGGLNLDAKGVAKVLKAYVAILAKLTAAAGKVNPDKFTYDDDEVPAPKAKAEKKSAPRAKKAKPADDEEEDDESVEADDQDDEVEEADEEDDD